ncbi:MAG: hypothetical protein A2X13_02065 [Bacteroidetes bacterium GWC2_33_15]|nr:MAG: hypothetical protein A2X10_07560 [Bacteroidetes bacterium GWA2_33_15]OFX52264.1 MAG: hypothetical protein A2X13_02065 [Bacteroidetes bacterium GWC2_33_15]OFX64418.1 MAG: hypothetical protein A2X15_12885 [Bacteroidetes bacterium GWB2_32_14]OFX67823.1 MAG: hypothetical protein A2X14_06710 [Bacteroidetes bacterium GWD2_33_33]HAN19437.1 hypothetical protein [Bacteroidales bacterium]
MNKIFKLPKPLKAYEQSGFIVQQRARFVYYLCVAALLTTLFVLLKTSYNHLTSDIYGQLYFPVLTPIIAGFLGYFFCLILLIRGYYNLSANLILVIAISIVWFALIGSEDKSVSRVDAVAYVFVVLSMVPLLIKKGKYLPFLYSLVSIGFFLFFVLSNQDDIGIYGKNLIDYIIDTSLSFILIGFIGYNIFSINKAALDRAEEDIKERKEAESAFAKSEKNTGKWQACCLKQFMKQI